MSWESGVRQIEHELLSTITVLQTLNNLGHHEPGVDSGAIALEAEKVVRNFFNQCAVFCNEQNEALDIFNSQEDMPSCVCDLLEDERPTHHETTAQGEEPGQTNHQTAPCPLPIDLVASIHKNAARQKT